MTYLPTTNDKRQLGVNSFADNAPLLDARPFDEVFDREFTSDVHFLTYNLIGPDGKPDPAHPRINKPCLAEIRELGGEVVTVALVFDFDLKDQEDFADLPHDDEGKPTWTRDALYAFFKTLPMIDAALAERGIGPPMVYTTLHGGRFIHRLSKPVVCELGEDLMRGLLKTYGDIGLVMDPACKDWTRLFRAPKVTRNDVPQWEQRWFSMRNVTKLTNPDAINPISLSESYKDRYGKIEMVSGAKPTPEQAYARMFVAGKSGQKDTEMLKEAKRVLRGTEVYGPCFDGRDIDDGGGRDNALVKLVGSAVTRLLHPQATSFDFQPEDVYGIFLDAVQQLDPDPGTPDWTEALWSKVTRFYPKEKAKLQFEEQQRDARRVQAAEEARSMLDIVRETCGIPELHSEDETTAQVALSRLLLIREPSGRYRALKPDGSYSENAVAQIGLHGLVRNCGLEDHIALYVEDDKGKMKAVGENALARRAADVASVEGAVGIDRSHVEGDSWDSLVLKLKLYRRNPKLDAEFSPEVDEWLQLLTNDWPTLRRWLAYALHFEGGPICALSLAGAAGAGKGMLAQGLVETLEKPRRADKTALVRNFNDDLRYSPFLIVDEGLPKGEHDIADTFRSLTGGDPTKVEAKYQTPVEIRNPMRILFTANNLDVVHQLASHRMNDANDQAALAIRLLHLDVKAAATAHLNAMGGIEHTRGWVQGADGSPSSFKLAKHLLWLHERREQWGPRDARLLVEGRPDTNVVQSLRIAGSIPEAIATAIVMGLETKMPAVQAGICLEEDRLRVTSGAIKEMHDQLRDQKKTNVQLSSGRIGQAMSNLVSSGVAGSERARRQNMLGASVQQRWWDVDVRLLWGYAEEAGLKRDTLEKLVIEQYGPEAIR